MEKKLIKRLKSIKCESIDEKGKFQGTSVIHISTYESLRNYRNYLYLLNNYMHHDKVNQFFNANFVIPNKFMQEKDYKNNILDIVSTLPQNDGSASLLPVYSLGAKNSREIYFFRTSKATPKNKLFKNFFKYNKRNLLGKINITDSKLLIYRMTPKITNLKNKFKRDYEYGEYIKNKSKILKYINNFVKNELIKSKNSSSTNFLQVKLDNGTYSVYEVFYNKASLGSFIDGTPFQRSIGCCLILNKP
jgi:hypothetical protein